MSKIHDLIGQTPLIQLQHLSPSPLVEIYAKMESHNPGGSVKDRPAKNMLIQALKEGRLKQGDHIIEATSGNTGIALAMVGQQLGIHVTLVMPENNTLERIETMKAYGANLVLTPSSEPFEYCRDLALSLSKEKGYVILDQFNNPHNRKAHYKSTGPEIWEQSQHRITHFVSAMGTTGTITGTGTFLKEQNPSIRIIGGEPSDGSKIPGIRKRPPAYVPSIFNPEIVDEKKTVTQQDAEMTAKLLAAKEGILCGKSAGGAGWIALELAKELERGVIVFIVCDTGSRYLSSGLFS